MTDYTTYLMSLRCGACEDITTYAYTGPEVAADQEEPWPKVNNCPKCAQPYPNDLAHAMVQVSALPDPPELLNRGENL